MKNFKAKAANFFYYYKWHILIALFFVITISIMVLQMCTKKDDGITVMYAGNAILTDTQSAGIEKAFSDLMGEENGAALYELTIMTDEQLSAAYDNGYSPYLLNREKIRKNRETFGANILSDECFILILSPECFETALSGGALERLSDIGVAENGAAVNEYALKLSELGFARQYISFSAFPDDTLICFKRISEINSSRKSKQEMRAECIELFCKMAEYKRSGAVAE